MLEKKKLNDDEAVMRVEKAQPKVKEANKKEEKAEVEGKEAAAKMLNLRRLPFPAKILDSDHQDVSLMTRTVPSKTTMVRKDAYDGGGNGVPRSDYSSPGRRDGYVRSNGGYLRQ
ncbi:hypothetical protein GQ55_9G013000 [Panicum hallii var. hallii]|uniref:Uncharacterized protein n=1 Tax=Panicum hallii var. hallii TaxID=1504633 RepID=A0A2T7BYD3_9POAL|nr:hypothetical protein GQ55_9G013000 [Panicum hallii var. hallii]